MLEEHSLKVVAVGFHTRRGYDVAEEIERRVAATKAAMKFAADLRAPVVINQIGRVPSEPAGPAWQMLSQSLTDLSVYGQHVGAVLAAQTGSESGADLGRLLDALPPQGIGVDLDPGKLIINGFSPFEAVQSLVEPHPARACPRRSARPGPRPWIGSAAGPRLGRFRGAVGRLGRAAVSRLFYDCPRGCRRSRVRNRRGGQVFEKL